MGNDDKTLGLFDYDGGWFFNILIDELSKKKSLDEYKEDEIKEITKKVLEGFTPDMAECVLGTLKEGMAAKLKERRAEIAEFEEHIGRIWRKPIDLLEIFLELCLEAAILFHEKMDSHVTSENKYLYQALLRLHARGCQVGAEVLTLLNSGFADGAHARWRTLYEITVVAYFIRMHGNDVAERYIRHNTIESYRAMNVYQNCYKRLGYDPYTEEDIAGTTEAFTVLCERYGPSFKNRYGWSSEVLNKKDVKFSDIEKSTKFDHMRAHYKLASHNVHAGPKGIVFKLGMPEKSPDIIHLLPGPSDAGFTDPAHCTAISLYQLTAALLTLGNNPTWFVIIKILEMLEREIGQAFLEVDKQLRSSKI
ncbi:MAG TPA: DUF5677 domain-containing protein [Methanothrix sp.]|nr:DUF5677 domain-containing protein [Methanothrix sp.]